MVSSQKHLIERLEQRHVDVLNALFESLNEDEKNCENNLDEIQGDLDKLLLKLNEMKDFEPIEIRRSYKDILVSNRNDKLKNFHSIQVFSDEFVDIPRADRSQANDKADEKEVVDSFHTLADHIELTLSKKQKLLPQPVEDISLNGTNGNIDQLYKHESFDDQSMAKKHDFDCQCDIENEKYNDLVHENKNLSNSYIYQIRINKNLNAQLESKNAEISKLVESLEKKGIEIKTKLKHEEANKESTILLESNNARISELEKTLENIISEKKENEIKFKSSHDKTNKRNDELVRANKNLNMELEARNSEIQKLEKKIDKLMLKLERSITERSEFEIKFKVEQEEANKRNDEQIRTNSDLSVQLEMKIDEISNLSNIIETKLETFLGKNECHSKDVTNELIDANKNLSLQLETQFDEINHLNESVRSLKDAELKNLDEIRELKLQLSKRANNDPLVSSSKATPENDYEEINYDCHEIHSLEDLISNYLKLIKSYKKILARLDEVKTDHSQLKVSFNHLNTRYLKLRESTSENEIKESKGDECFEDENSDMKCATKDDVELNNMKIAYEHLYILYTRQKVNFFSDYNKLHGEYLNAIKTSSKQNSNENL